MATKNQRPLGEILHVVNRQAICHPLTPFLGKNWRALVEDRVIGKLDDPFGNVERPFQAINLKDDVKEEEIIGKQVLAIKLNSNKSKDKRRRKRK
ncbi:MAG: hypothetical protein INQ03_05255 [Candidatus Heimdallarchaeota archaeon]|nr:hypothetical protein [Candidatus Heimdallarchaeota archaeon]